ncbi:MAG: cell division protein ZapA [Desulfotomaculales bacterium]
MADKVENWDELENRVEVEIFGEEYVLRGNEPPAYMEMLAQYVNKKMRQVVTRNPRLSTAKAAILTALNIADELMKLQKEHDRLVRKKQEEERKKSPKKHFENQLLIQEH